MRVPIESIVVEFDPVVRPGVPFQLRLSGFDAGTPPLSVSFFVIGRTESPLVLTTSVSMEAEAWINWPTSVNAPSGPGYVHFVLSNDATTLKIAPPPDSFPIFYGDTALSDEAVAIRVGAAREAQKEVSNKPIVAVGYDGTISFAVHFAMHSCPLAFDERIEGGHLRTTGHMLKPVATFEALDQIFGAHFAEAAGPRSHPSPHPVVVLTFNNVLAPDHAAARGAVEGRLQMVCSAMAMESGMAPVVFAAIVVDHRTGAQQATLNPTYRAVTQFGFGPGAITARLSDLVRAAELDPWLAYVVPLFVQAVAETHAPFQALRFWSILEAAAKRRPRKLVEAPGGSKRFQVHGQTVRGRDLATVVDYVLTETTLRDGSPRNPETEADGLRAWYGIRNIVAHEGAIRPEALTEAKRQEAQAVLSAANLRGIRGLVELALAAEARRALGDA